MLRTSKAKSDYIKGQIRDSIIDMLGKFMYRIRLFINSPNLVKITGNTNAKMQYLKYHQEIVMRYSVMLVGWSHPTFANPSDLSTSLVPLQTLLDDIKSGKCKFVKLTAAERKAEDDKYHKKVQNGEIVLAERAIRKDKGTKRKRADSEAENQSESDKENEPSKKQHRRTRKGGKGTKAAPKSAPFVEPSDDSDD